MRTLSLKLLLLLQLNPAAKAVTVGIRAGLFSNTVLGKDDDHASESTSDSKLNNVISSSTTNPKLKSDSHNSNVGTLLVEPADDHAAHEFVNIDSEDKGVFQGADQSENQMLTNTTTPTGTPIPTEDQITFITRFCTCNCSCCNCSKFLNWCAINCCGVDSDSESNSDNRSDGNDSVLESLSPGLSLSDPDFSDNSPTGRGSAAARRRRQADLVTQLNLISQLLHSSHMRDLAHRSGPGSARRDESHVSLLRGFRRNPNPSYRTSTLITAPEQADMEQMRNLLSRPDLDDDHRPFAGIRGCADAYLEMTQSRRGRVGVTGGSSSSSSNSVAMLVASDSL